MDRGLEIPTIEASVRAWKTIFAAIVAMDIKSAEAVHTLQLLESIERNFAGSSDELKKLSTLLFVK